MPEGQGIPFDFLVVDDSEFARMTLIKALTKLGGRLAGEAVTGQDAVQKYRSLRPDIVFMDITMPGMEGVDALERIIADDNAAKVVMVSSLGHQTLIQEALKKGAKQFITKPVQYAPLSEIVRFVLTH